MDDVIRIQINELLHFCLTGIEISFLFDLFRAKRRAIKTSVIITNIEDVIYWIISGVIIICTITRYTNGDIRSYMVTSFITGITIYFFFVSRYVLKLLVKVFNIFLFPIKKINKLIKKY